MGLSSRAIGAVDFEELVGGNDFSFRFRKIITHYRRIGYTLDVMRQSACLLFNPVVVDSCAAVFGCAPVGRASDSGLDIKLFILVGWGRGFLSVAWPTGVQLVFFFCSGVSGLFGAQGSPSSGGFGPRFDSSWYLSCFICLSMMIH